MNKVLSVVSKRIIFRNIRSLCCGQYQVKYYHNVNHEASINTFCKQNVSSLSLIKRYKHKKKSSAKKLSTEEDLESDEEEDIEHDESRSKSRIITAKVNSLRVDFVTKTGLGLSRRKVEEAFYESKIRINGKKVLKLSTEVTVDDEIDIIHSRSDDNPNLLIVSRVTLVSIEPATDGIKCKMYRDKNLLIEEYSEPWNDK